MVQDRSLTFAQWRLEREFRPRVCLRLRKSQVWSDEFRGLILVAASLRGDGRPQGRRPISTQVGISKVRERLHAEWKEIVVFVPESREYGPTWKFGSGGLALFDFAACVASTRNDKSSLPGCATRVRRSDP